MCRFIGVVLAAFVMMAVHTSANAQFPSLNCNNLYLSGFTAYKSFALDPNLPNGAVVVDWFDLASHGRKCDSYKTSFTFSVLFRPTGLSPSGSGTYRLNDYLGYQLQWKTDSSQSGSGQVFCDKPWTSVTTPVNNSANITICSANPLGTKSVTVTVKFRARIVKIGNVPSNASSGTLNFAAANVRFGAVYAGESPAQINYTLPPPPSCNVSAQPSFINLGSVTPPQIPSVGSATSPQPFSFILSCTPGRGAVKYRLEDYPTRAAPSNNVLRNTASWAAAGVGIQILNASGSGLPSFNNDINLPGWNSNTGGTYTVGLSARILRTQQNTSPGSLNSQMQLTVKYQ